jgi:hypothetical protein
MRSKSGKPDLRGPSPAMTADAARLNCYLAGTPRNATGRCAENPAIVSHCFYQWILQPQRVWRIEPANFHHGDVVESHHAARRAVV